MTYRSHWWNLASVQIGGAVCLPIFVIGHMLTSKFGLMSAILAICIGNCILLLLSMPSSVYAAVTRKSTPEIAEEAFGLFGQSYFSILFIVSMLGWFALQLDMMGSLTAGFLGYKSGVGVHLLLGLAITIGTLRGITSIETVARVSFPLLLATIGYAIYQATTTKVLQYDPARSISFEGIIVAVSAALSAVLDLPTFFRFANTKKDALYASFLLFGLALPILEGVGVLLASYGSSSSFIASLQEQGNSVLWNGWTALFIIVAGWTTNNTNLYSAAVNLQTCCPRSTMTKNHLLLGLIGTLLSTFDIQGLFFILLETLGTLLTAAGGVLLIHQLTNGATEQRYNLLGLFSGIVMSVLGLFKSTFTGSALVDACFISAFFSSYGAYIKFQNDQKRKIEFYDVY